jgi:hypothetical protein
MAIILNATPSEKMPIGLTDLDFLHDYFIFHKKTCRAGVFLHPIFIDGGFLRRDMELNSMPFQEFMDVRGNDAALPNDHLFSIAECSLDRRFVQMERGPMDDVTRIRFRAPIEEFPELMHKKSVTEKAGEQRAVRKRRHTHSVVEYTPNRKSLGDDSQALGNQCHLQTCADGEAIVGGEKKKRPPTGWILFSNCHRPEVKKQLGAHATNAEVIRKVSEDWRNLPDAKKNAYVQTQTASQTKKVKSTEGYRKRRPANPFILFAKEMRGKLKGEHADQNKLDKLRSEWKNMSLGEKEVYVNAYNAAVKAYNAEVSTA